MPTGNSDNTPYANLLFDAIVDWGDQAMKARPLYERAYRKAREFNALADAGLCSPEDARQIRYWYRLMRLHRHDLGKL